MVDGVLRCARVGLGATLRYGLLGGYDGAGAWTLTVANIRSDDEQFMAELHEGLHHELQISSGWGLVASMAWLMSVRGFRTHALGELFQVMVAGARQTHEVFATTLSATADGIEHGYQLLAGNPRYRGYLSRGLALVEPADVEFWQFHHAAISSVLRVCMQPAATLDLFGSGFGRLVRGDLDRDRDSPDRRLAAFERLGGPASWGPVFRDLLERYPDRGGDPERGAGRRQLPADPAALDRLHQFEAEILVPRCYAHVCAVLGEAGLPSVGSRQQSQLAKAAHAAVLAVDSELAGHIVLAAERRSLSEEALELERQQVVLRERLPVRLVRDQATFRDPALFQDRDSHGQRSACAVWIDQKVARKQFAFPAHAELPALVTALITGEGPAGPTGFIRVGLMTPGSTPQQCRRAVGDTPVVALTTHATLARHAEALAMLQTVEPVFVLMDLPVRRHVGHWIRQGATVRIWASSIERAGVSLGLVTFAINQRHPFVFLCIGSEASTYLLADQMRQQHPGSVEMAKPARDGGWQTAQELAVHVVLSTWHVLDQRGAT